jgi:hypothetical protein
MKSKKKGDIILQKLREQDVLTELQAAQYSSCFSVTIKEPCGVDDLKFMSVWFLYR